MAILTLPSVPFLKPTGARQARGQLAVHLALGGARADRAPADQVADVLRADHVEELAARRHAQAVDLHQQLARDAQALVDAVALVEVRVVDQALPADRGARLLEVHAHHDLQRVGVLLAQRLQPARVVQRRGRVVDRARADDHQQPVVLALHDLAHRVARPADQLLHRRAGNREEADQVFRRRQRRHVLDALVVGLAGLLAERIAAFRGAAASRVHGPGSFWSRCRAQKNRRGCRRFFWGSVRRVVLRAQRSPAAGWGRKPVARKVERGRTHGAAM